MIINKKKFTRTIVCFVSAIVLFIIGCNYVLGDCRTNDREYKIVVVSSGDSLWKIASSNNDLGDIRKKMSEIKSFNDLDGSDLYVNQVLKIPVNR